MHFFFWNLEKMGWDGVRHVVGVEGTRKSGKGLGSIILLMDSNRGGAWIRFQQPFRVYLYLYDIKKPVEITSWLR